MCRKSQMRGYVLLGLGVGLIIGYMVDSWLLCSIGGCGMIAAGFWMITKR